MQQVPPAKPQWSVQERIHCKVAELGTAFLRMLPPEVSHDLGLKLLQTKLFDQILCPTLPDGMSGFRTSVSGIGDLAHPIGLAAGFDKNGVAPRGFAKIGFSFLEVGTVTPVAQAGNPKPRLFRYPSERSLINRMGFNSDGQLTVADRLRRLKWDHDKVPLGVNVGKNASTDLSRAAEDYLQGYDAFRDLAKYVVFNISSPNTTGLRDLANVDFIQYLAERIGQDINRVWLKLDPDSSKQDFQQLIEIIAEKGFQGVILSNTHKVTEPEAGGLSGHPLAIMSTARLEWAYEVHKGALTMVASGGVLSGRDVFEKLARGAKAVQVYSGLVYRGPWVVAMLLSELWTEMRLRGFSCVSDVVGTYYYDV